MTSSIPEHNFLKQRIELHERLFSAFYKIVQAVRIHDDTNEVVLSSAKDFIQIIRIFRTEEDRLSIRIDAGRLFIQEERLVIRRQAVNLYSNAIAYLEKRKLHGFSISTDIGQQHQYALLAFARLLNQSENQEDPSQWLEHQIERQNFNWIEILTDSKKSEVGSDGRFEVVPTAQKIDSDQRQLAREKAGKNAYVCSLAVLKEISEKVVCDKPGGIRKALRTVQNMIDLIWEDEFVMLGLSTLRDYDDYTYVHSVNVAILAMCLGKHLNLSRDSMEILGICGLFHDLGKIEIPIEIINKPSKLNSQELEEVQKHVLKSVRLILKLRASRTLKSQILLAPFEHHLKYNLSGYPQTSRRKPLSLFGRILAIADVYDALTSPRIYRKTAMSPDLALKIMIKEVGKDYDPILLKMFVNMMGVYPLGTLIKTDRGELALVTKHSKQSDPTRPEAVLLQKNGTNSFRKGAAIKLSAKDPNTGDYLRNIVHSDHPFLFGIQAAQYIL